MNNTTHAPKHEVRLDSQQPELQPVILTAAIKVVSRSMGTHTHTQVQFSHITLVMLIKVWVNVQVSN